MQLPFSQLPIKPSEQFAYEFTPPDAGTFWYHPHADSLRQLGRGMAGALIVGEPDPPAVDRDVVVPGVRPRGIGGGRGHRQAAGAAVARPADPAGSRGGSEQL